MQLTNIFPINNWPLRRLVILTISLTLAIWAMVYLDMVGISIPLVRQIVGAIYIIFLPGTFLLRILKVSELNITEMVLFSIGSSLTVIMIIGFLLNILYYFALIQKPIVDYMLLIAFNIVLLILIILSYFDKAIKNNSEHIINLDDYFSNKCLIIYLLIPSTITGAYIFNYFDNNILAIINLLAIGLASIIIINSGIYSESFYPLAVWIISISLLFHNSLTSTYISGWDIHNEYYISNIVIQNGFWNWEYPNTANGMLSITILAPFFSSILSMDLVWIYKIIYPLIFSFVPLGLYCVYVRQFGSKIAMLSSLFFMSIFVFFTEMLSLARQEIAEFFFVLLMIAIVNKNIPQLQRSILFILTSFSIVVSHYSVSFILQSALIVSIALTYLYKSSNVTKFKRISFSSTMLFIIFSTTWFIYIANSSAFINFLDVFKRIFETFLSELLNPVFSQSMTILINPTTSMTREIAKFMNLIFQAFIVIGFVSLLLIDRNKIKLDRDYETLSIFFILFDISAIIVPWFSRSFGTSRIVHIALFFLAPFSIYGGLIFVKKIYNILHISNKHATWYLSISISILLLFNSGVITEMIKDDKPIAYSLNKSIDFAVYNEREVFGARWISDKKNNNPIFGDWYRSPLLASTGSLEWNLVSSISRTFNFEEEHNYIYLGTLNNKEKTFLIPSNFRGVINEYIYINFEKKLRKKAKLYDNSGSSIYYN